MSPANVPPQHSASSQASSAWPSRPGQLPVACPRANTTSSSGQRRPGVASDEAKADELHIEVTRLRAFLVRIADAVDLALDSDWRVAIDILIDLSDEIRAEFLP